MCYVQRDLVGGSISNADDGEDTEEDIGSDEEFDSDNGDLGEEKKIWICFPLFLFIYVVICMFLDDVLLSVGQENAKLLVKSLFAGVFLMISREEEGLFSELAAVKMEELAVRRLMSEQMGNGSFDLSYGSLSAEMEKFTSVVGVLSGRLKELSDLEVVVSEMQGLDPEVTEVLGLTQRELQDFSSGIVSELENISVTWGGGID